MKKKLFLAMSAALVLTPLLSTRAVAALTAPAGLPGPATLGDLITVVTNLLLGIAGTVAVIFIIIGGIRYASSGGNEQNVEKAKSTITNAVVGLIITILALGIVNFIISTFK